MSTDDESDTTQLPAERISYDAHGESDAGRAV